jgi:ketosteroid isomerase-like protein
MKHSDSRMQLLDGIASNVLATLASLDSEGLRRYLAQDVVLELPFAPIELGPRLIRGVDAVVQTMSRARTVYQSLSFSILERYPAPSRDTVLFRAKSEGVFKTGASYANEYMQVFTFDGNEVIHWIEFFDAIVAKNAFAPSGQQEG